MFFYSFLSFSCRRLSNIDFIYSHDFTCFNIVIVSKNSSISVWDDDDDGDDDDDDAKLTLWSRQRVIGSSHFISFSWMPDVGSLQESTPWIFRFQHEDLPFGDQGYGWAESQDCFAWPVPKRWWRNGEQDQAYWRQVCKAPRIWGAIWTAELTICLRDMPQKQMLIACPVGNSLQLQSIQWIVKTFEQCIVIYAPTDVLQRGICFMIVDLTRLW